MDQAINFFTKDPGRFERFQEEFRAQDVLNDSINDILDHHGDQLKPRGGEERDLSLIIIASIFGKAKKTFQAVMRLCALGYGEDALILIRSNINLLINVLFILADNEPIERTKEFNAYSLQERIKFIDIAFDGQYPEWMQNVTDYSDL